MTERIIITFEKDGSFRGASATDFDGLPQALDAEALATVLPDLNTAALARVTELEAKEKDDKEAADKALADAKSEAAPALQASQAEVAALQARVEALTPKPSETPSTITKLHEVFTTSLTPEAQAAFAMPYAIVRVLVDAGQYALAAAVVTGIVVPEELQAAKQGILDLLQS